MLFWKLIYLLRSWLVSVPLIFCFLWFQSETECECIWPVGFFVFFCGWIIRIWAQQHLLYRLKTHKNLAGSGPYRYVRNPVYIGTIIIFLGMTILSELIWMIPITLVWSIIVYSLVVHYEEMHLLQRYGESYQKFMNEVPRWIPRIPSLKNLGIINDNFKASVFAELNCLLYLMPYILKEVILTRLGY